MIGSAEDLFMCILVICIFSTEKCVSGSLPILNQVVCFFVVEFYFTVYCRYQIYDLKYFCPFCGLPFYSIATVFWCTSIYFSWSPICPYFLLLPEPLVSYLRSHCQIQCCEVFALHFCLSSVQFSRSVVSDSLRPHESQHTRPPYPSPSPGVHSNSRPLSRRCHPAISSSVIPFSSCPQSLPASESFPMSQLFAWGGQSTGVSASASFPPKKSQGWSPSEWTGWLSLQSKGLSRVFSNTTRVLLF